MQEGGHKELPSVDQTGRAVGLPSSCSELNQGLSHRIYDRLCTVVNLQFLVDVADVVTDGLLADFQGEGDLLYRSAHPHQIQDLARTPRQSLIELLRGAGAVKHAKHAVGCGAV